MDIRLSEVISALSYGLAGEAIPRFGRILCLAQTSEVFFAHRVLAGFEPEGRVQRADEERLDRVAEAFAMIVDAKSPTPGTTPRAWRGSPTCSATARASAATCGGPHCCTTSASSASPT